MSGIERRYQKQVDEIILEASPEDLKTIQELDLKTQLSGNSFYESFSIHTDAHKKLESQTSPLRKNHN
jgi:hypothetical protein